jgi:membrane fusion protein, multidrug efflux system
MTQKIKPRQSLVRNRMLRFGLPLALIAALGGCSGGGASDASAAQAATDAKKSEAKKSEAVAVEVEPVTRRSIAASYSGTAALEAPHEAQVVAKTSGVLLKLEAEEGDRVRAGQALARIDPERARLEVQRTDATLRKLEAEFNRSKELFERKLVAAEAHERLRYDIETQRAANNIAKLELSYTTIVAPIDGVIARRMVKEGNLVPLNAPVFRIVNTDRLEAILNVPERELGTMQPGLAVALLVDALPGQRIEGRIDRVSPVIDPGTGTFRVTTAFAGSDRLRPGMFGRIEVIYDRRADVLTVPRSALLEGEGEAAVFAVRDGKAVRTGLRLGHVNGTYAEVVSGIEEGDQVVTVGKVTLRDGATVEVVNLPPPAKLDAAAAIAQASAGTVASE